MLLNVFDRNLPAVDGMAILALRAHLSAMDVGMALRAFVANVSEDRLHVALRTRDFCVHAAQRVGRFAMVEIRDRPNRLPAQTGMAGLAGNVERAVGAARGCAILRR